MSAYSNDHAGMLAHAADIVTRSGMGSQSMIQRKVRCGFVEAQTLLLELEDLGIVGPSRGTIARKVLVSADEARALIENAEVQP